MNKMLFTFMATFLLSLSLAGNALAQNIKTPEASPDPSAQFTIYPTYLHGDNKSWIIRQAEPGTSVTDSITVQNLTNKNINLTLNIQEAEEKEGMFMLKETPAQNLGLWTKVDTQNIQLGPKQKKRIPVNINVPQSVEESSTYVASILAVKESLNEQNIKIVTRIGVRIYLNIVPSGTLEANVLNATPQNLFFFILSLVGLLAAIFYNIIYYREKRNHETET